MMPRHGDVGSGLDSATPLRQDQWWIDEPEAIAPLEPEPSIWDWAIDHRAWVAIGVLVIVVGLLLGLTAPAWNPWARGT